MKAFFALTGMVLIFCIAVGGLVWISSYSKKLARDIHTPSEQSSDRKIRPQEQRAKNAAKASVVSLQKDTMKGNEAVSNNGIMTLSVRGLYQEMFSGKWKMGISTKPLRDMNISKIEYSYFDGQDRPLRAVVTKFSSQIQAGIFEANVEREIDIPFIHPAASMLISFSDGNEQILSKFLVVGIVDFMVGHGLLPDESRALYENGQ